MSTTILPDDVREFDTYIVGQKRSGKSTLLCRIIINDILHNRGVVLIDPHADLARDILGLIPKYRKDDVIYIEPKTCPVPISMFAGSEELNIMAGEMITIFERMQTGWGPRMNDVLRFTIHAIADLPCSTFETIADWLQSSSFRDKNLHWVKNEAVRKFWLERFSETYYKDAESPILARMTQFLIEDQIRNIFCRSGGISLKDKMDSGKVVIINLGQCTESNARLIGSIIVSQIQMAIRMRADPKNRRTPVYLFIDEFETFISQVEPFKYLLSQAGKFNIRLTLVNQFPSQLPPDMLNAIRGNVGNYIVLSSDAIDAHCLRFKIRPFKPEDLENLSTEGRHAIYKQAHQANAKEIILKQKPYRKVGCEDYTSYIIAQSHALIDPSSQPQTTPLEFSQPHGAKSPETNEPDDPPSDTV